MDDGNPGSEPLNDYAETRYDIASAGYRIRAQYGSLLVHSKCARFSVSMLKHVWLSLFASPLPQCWQEENPTDGRRIIKPILLVSRAERIQQQYISIVFRDELRFFSFLGVGTRLDLFFQQTQMHNHNHLQNHTFLVDYKQF